MKVSRNLRKLDQLYSILISQSHLISLFSSLPKQLTVPGEFQDWSYMLVMGHGSMHSDPRPSDPSKFYNPFDPLTHGPIDPLSALIL